MKPPLPPHRDLRFHILAGTVIVLAIGVSALLTIWYRRVQERTVAFATELHQLKAQWEVASVNLNEARHAQARFDAFAEQAVRVTQECDRPSWSSALQAIVACSESGIQLRDVRANRPADESKPWSLRIAGCSAGKTPRSSADTYRLKMHGELERVFETKVSTRFEKLEELSKAGGNVQGEQTAAFTIVATIEPVERLKEPAKHES